MSPSQGAGPFYSQVQFRIFVGHKVTIFDSRLQFIFQLAMLFISTIAATVQTYYKVNYWRKEKVAGDRESIKELVMGIVFDTYWPILGVYPSIVVWFDYKGLSFIIISRENSKILIG